MLYLYDNAVCDNLKASLTDELNKNVFITDADNYPGILAQIQNDTITYPLILLHRDEDTPINTDLINFSRYKFGVPCVFDNATNNIYYEKALPSRTVEERRDDNPALFKASDTQGVS